jgi:peptidoglycan/LPS O-acetylase OafA/YrhL
VTRRSDDLAARAGWGVRRSAVVAGVLSVAALAAAVATFAVTGPPYATNIAGGVLYLVGLLAGLVAGVLLWLAWAELREDMPPGRLRWGVGTATWSLLLVCACAVVTLSHVASGTAQLWLIGATALVTGLAVVSAAGADGTSGRG